MGVVGKYVSKFAEASHAVFDGHLDDPSFRQIAIQRITKLEADSVTLDESGRLTIQTRNGRQCVRACYVCPLFGKQTATGHPFKDERTDAIAGQLDLFGKERGMMCGRKRAFETEDEARQKGQPHYRCPHCGKWHRSGQLARLLAELKGARRETRATRKGGAR